MRYIDRREFFLTCADSFSLYASTVNWLENFLYMPIGVSRWMIRILLHDVNVSYYGKMMASRTNKILSFTVQWLVVVTAAAAYMKPIEWVNSILMLHFLFKNSSRRGIDCQLNQSFNIILTLISKIWRTLLLLTLRGDISNFTWEDPVY